jgi:hypothetical protein
MNSRTGSLHLDTKQNIYWVHSKIAVKRLWSFHTFFFFLKSQ